MGLRRHALKKAEMRPPDAVIGPVNQDGSLQKGAIRGGLPETVDY